MPIREVRIDDLGNAHRIHWIPDIEENPVSLAGTRGKPDLGKGGDVVAGGRLPSLLRTGTVVSAVPQARYGSRFRIRKDPRFTYDSRLVRGIERNLDDRDPPERGIQLLRGKLVETPG